MKKPQPLPIHTWVPAIPKYNKTYQHTLETENQYFFYKGKLLKFGAKFFESFPVTRTPDHFYHPETKTEQEVKKMAMEFMLGAYQEVFIYWWGPNNKNPNKVTSIKVKFRNLVPIDFDEEKMLIKKLNKFKVFPLGYTYSNRTRKFAKNNKKEINLMEGKTSFRKTLKNTIRKYVSLDLKYIDIK